MLLTLLRGAAAAGAGVSGAYTLQRRRTQQPQIPVGVDLAQANLQRTQVVVWRDQALDASSRTRLTREGTVTLAATPQGVGLSFSASGNNRAFANTTRTYAGNEGFTIEVLCAVTAVASLSGFFALQQPGGGANGRIRGLLGFGGGNNRNIYFWGGGNDLSSGVEWRIDGSLQHVLVTSDGGAGTPMKFYRDGREIASGTTPAGLITTTNPSIVVGDMVQGWLANPVGTILKAAYYRRALSASEVRDITINPWQVFQRRQSEYFATLGASGTPGNATGTTLTAALSLTAGAATGAAAAAGATLTATTSLVAGVATGAADAAGVTLTDTLSFIPGAASVGGAGNAAGVTLTATTSLLAGAATGAASAAGTTITATLSLIPGAASAGVLAAGVTLTATASFTAGAATGAAAAAGRVLTSALSFTPGFATGGGLSSAPGAQITVTASLITGTAETFPTSDTPSRIRIGGRVMNDATRIGSFVMRKNNRPIRH